MMAQHAIGERHVLLCSKCNLWPSNAYFIMFRQLDRYSKSLWDKRIRLGRKHHPLPASTTTDSDLHSLVDFLLFFLQDKEHRIFMFTCPTKFTAIMGVMEPGSNILYGPFSMDPRPPIDHVLKNIRDGIDNGLELLQFIPDSPFPARGLIGALAHLVKLGAVCGSNQNILDESLLIATII